MFNRGQFTFWKSWREPAALTHEALEEARDRGIAQHTAILKRALEAGDTGAVIQAQSELEEFLKAARATTNLSSLVDAVLDRAEPAPTVTVVTYWVSSATLVQAHAYLTRREPGTVGKFERMLAVTGLRLGNIYTLEHLIEVKLASQSAAQASFDMQDFMRVASSLDEHGQALHAVFHNHPFTGPPHPSGTDDRLQRILEEGGYPAIQAVFSEDGYVRFFARRRKFAVQIYGKGVKQIEPNLYCISHFSTLPDPALVADGAGRGARFRSVRAHPRR